MKAMLIRHAWLFVFLATALTGAEPYNGPRPPSPDLPYLVHADNLVATEAAEASQETKKDEMVYSISGTSSPARTPLAEPIFLIQSETLAPEKLELYRLDVKNGRREIAMPTKGRRGKGPRPLHLSVTKLEGKLYRVEASEPLEDGQYSLSPSDSNKVFCFEVY